MSRAPAATVQCVHCATPIKRCHCAMCGTPGWHHRRNMYHRCGPDGCGETFAEPATLPEGAP